MKSSTPLKVRLLIVDEAGILKQDASVNSDTARLITQDADRRHQVIEVTVASFFQATERLFLINRSLCCSG